MGSSDASSFLYDRAARVTKITNKGQESFVLKQLVSNNSDNDGMLQLNIQIGGYGPSIDPRVSRKLPLAARQTKLLVTVWEEAPRQVDVNTLIAGKSAEYTEPACY